MKKEKKNFGWALQEMLSGRGVLSAKRICGAWLILLVSACTIYHVCTNGINEIAETLLETELIVATALLGITSVTGIFNKAKITTTKTTESSGTVVEEETTEGDCICPHGYDCPFKN